MPMYWAVQLSRGPRSKIRGVPEREDVVMWDTDGDQAMPTIEESEEGSADEFDGKHRKLNDGWTSDEHPRLQEAQPEISQLKAMVEQAAQLNTSQGSDDDLLVNEKAGDNPATNKDLEPFSNERQKKNIGQDKASPTSLFTTPNRQTPDVTRTSAITSSGGNPRSSSPTSEDVIIDETVDDIRKWVIWGEGLTDGSIVLTWVSSTWHWSMQITPTTKRLNRCRERPCDLSHDFRETLKHSSRGPE